MNINLDDYRDFLEQADPHVRDTLEASFAEAARVMSPRGLNNWLEGARGLCELGRGRDLVVSYLQAMPAVVKEVGEEIIPETVTAAMRLASMVSGEVIGLMFASLPTAARRLGDAGLLEQYLSLLHQLSAKAPRGLRPMLGRLDELFSKLTLGGLRRWALWGAQAHARDFAALGKYFALESADALAVLQKERRGTLFIDNQRKLNFYLRALWGRDFFLRPTSGDVESREGYKPFIENRVIHLPDAYDDVQGCTNTAGAGCAGAADVQGCTNTAGAGCAGAADVQGCTNAAGAGCAGAADWQGLPGKDLYRAAATHAAAHLAYTREPISAEALNPAQMFFIGLVEDARVEALASREFPGLKKLWLPFHRQLAAIDDERDPTVRRLERLAHALLDADYADDDPWINASAAAFREEFARRGEDNRLSWDLGVTLYNELGARAALPSLRVLESIAIPYRDDNRYVWAFDEIAWHEAEYVSASARQERRKVNVMEMVNEIDNELAGDDAQEIWTLETEFFRDGDPEGVSMNQLEGKEPVSEPYHYPEWDYQVQLHRPDWATVLEKRQGRGDPKEIDRTLLEYRPIASRLKHIIDAVQPQGVIRQRHQEDGEEIDLNAAIRAMVDLRMGLDPDPRVNIRIERKTRDLAVLVLLDLSESTNDVPPGADRPLLNLAREATTLLAWALDGIGDPFAVHGFASDGRHDVQYFRFKDFNQEWDEQSKSRLAGMRGGLSTRMGAALRHAGAHLQRQPQQKKLVLLVTDGEPADIDVRDPQYLRQDTRKAVEELESRGVLTYCLTLDPQADSYVSRIFGGRYTVVDHVQRLPERLPTLFMSLTA